MLHAQQEVVVEGSAPCVVINSKACTFSFALDALDVAAQLREEFIPVCRDDKVRGCTGRGFIGG